MTKPTKWHVRPAKTQISLGIRPVWSESLLCTQWVAKNPNFLHADSEDSDQTVRMPMDGWVRVLRPFNSISVISRWWKGEHERLCAMKRRLGSGRISPPAGFEPSTPWSKVGPCGRFGACPGWSESLLGAEPFCGFVMSWFKFQKDAPTTAPWGFLSCTFPHKA